MRAKHADPESITTIVSMDSGLAAEFIIGPRFVRTRWRLLTMRVHIVPR
jgi:hypothetical protein